MSFLGYNYAMPLEIRTNQKRFVNVSSVDGRIEYLHSGNQRWEFIISFTGGLTDSMVVDFMAHYQGNRNTSFSIPVPQLVDISSNDEISTLTFSSAEAVGQYELSVSTTNNLADGSLIRIGNKLYKIQEINPRNQSNMITIYPPLVTAASSGDTITIPKTNSPVTIDVYHRQRDTEVDLQWREFGRQRIRWRFIEAV